MTDIWVDEIYAGQSGAPTKFGVQATRVLAQRQSLYQKIEVFETAPSHKDEAPGRILLLDGCYMTETRFEHYYHEMLAQPALCAAHSVKRVLIIGGGDGGTLREVLRHPDVTHVTLCEIDEAVVRVAQVHLTEMGVPWDDWRVTYLYEDGVALMSTATLPTSPKFDLIIVDGADPAGPAAALFSEAFYRDCRRHLTPWSGILATQTLSPIVQRGHFLDAGRNLMKAFAHVSPYFGPMPIYPAGTWSYCLATDGGPPRGLYPKRPRLDVVEDGCRYYNGEIHHAAFALPNDLQAAWRAMESEVRSAKST